MTEYVLYSSRHMVAGPQDVVAGSHDVVWDLLDICRELLSQEIFIILWQVSITELLYVMRTVLRTLTQICSQSYDVVQQLRNVDLNVFLFSTRVDNICLVLWCSIMYHVAYGHIYHVSALLNSYQRYLVCPKDHLYVYRWPKYLLEQNWNYKYLFLVKPAYE